MAQDVFVNGAYLRKRPEWHVGDSPWKAREILQLMNRNKISPRHLAEIGCGTGEVLRQLQLQMGPECIFSGYDISPDAIALSRSRQNERLRCYLGDMREESDGKFDLLLILDVLEHQENYFGFLREIKRLAPYKLFHAVLDLSVFALMTQNGLTKRRNLLEDLHYFTKDMLIDALVHENYEVIDWCYVRRAIYKSPGIVGAIRQLPRRVSFALGPDFAVRVLGGYSLLVLAK